MISLNHPIVYDKLDTSFLGYGLAILENAMEIRIRELLNGEYSLKFALPITDSKWEYITEDNFVKVEGQLFVIRKISDVRQEELTCTVTCEHIFFLLLDDYIESLTLNGSATAALTAVLTGTEHVAGVVDVVGTNDLLVEDQNPVKAINEIIATWGGEIKADNWSVDLLTHRGSTTPYVQFRYHKNLNSIERTVDTSGLVTRLYVYGKDGLTIEGASLSGGKKYIDSQYIGNYRRPKTGSIQLDLDDVDTLYLAGKEYLATIDIPRVSYEANVIELKALIEYGSLEEFAMGDEVMVFDELLGINVQARVVDYERYPKEHTRSSVVLANFRPGIQYELSKLNEVKNQLVTNDGSMKVSTSWLEGIIDTLQNQLIASGSYATAQVLDKKGMLFENTNISSPDYGALYIGPGIFAIADEKIGSPPAWNWRTFGTGAGFTADLITTGKVLASFIQIGENGSLADWAYPGKTTIDGGRMELNTLIVGDNVTMGPNAVIVWDNLNAESKLNLKGDTGPQGIQGPAGYTPVKGTDYFDGVDGQNGTSSYLWVRYSQNANGNPMTTSPTGALYIGIAITTTALAPTAYASYSWSLIKGAEGIPGEAGANGQTSYLHIKYSDYSDGTSMNEIGGDYIGTYVDFTQADSTDKAVYAWNRIKGDTGAQGIQGATGAQGSQGAAGVSSYLHIKYSNYADGTDMNESGGTYIGTYVDSTYADSSDKAAYTWVLVKGATGNTGSPGAAGSNAYLHIKYSNDGTTFTSNSGETPGDWIGTYSDSTLLDSTVFSAYTWTKIKGNTGATGAQGAQGIQGIQGIQGPIGPNWSYLTSTKITQTTIESPIITGNEGRFAGYVIVGPDATTNNLAGISGFDAGDSAIRFWAGATYANRAIAPYSVNQKGEITVRHTNGNKSVLGAEGLKLYDNGKIMPYITSISADNVVPPEGYDPDMAEQRWTGWVGGQDGNNDFDGYPTYTKYLIGKYWKEAVNNLKLMLFPGATTDFGYSEATFNQKCAQVEIVASEYTVIITGIITTGGVNNLVLTGISGYDFWYFNGYFLEINGETVQIESSERSTVILSTDLVTACSSGNAYKIVIPDGVKMVVESWFRRRSYDNSYTLYDPRPFDYLLVRNDT